MAQAQEGPSGNVTGQHRRARVAHHVGAVVGIGKAKGDAQRGVGPHRIADHAGRPLGGQDHVDAEAPAPLGDVEHTFEERRHLGDQRGELVDHHHQRGRAVPGRELGQRRHPVVVEDPLASAQLGPQRGEGPADRGRR